MINRILICVSSLSRYVHSSKIFDTIYRLLIQTLCNEKQTLTSVSNNGENDRCGLAGSDGFRLLNDIIAYALVEKRIILTTACLIIACEIEL